MNIGQALSVAAAALVMAFFTSPAEAQREFLDRAQIHAAVEELAELMEDNYVFPEIARAYAERLRTRLASGAYDRLNNPAELATTMTTDLNGVHHDAHLRVSLAEQDEQGRPRTRSIRSEGAFGEDRWLADGVAYVRISVLPGDEDSVQRMGALLDQYEDARVLVLDLRACRGGTQPVMDVILSRLYAEPTRLMNMDTRGDGADMFPEAANMRREEAPDGIHRVVHYALPTTPVSPLADAQVYVLTDVTASACEHLAAALQSTGRAALVGGVTRGAGHYGNHRLFADGRFQVFVPVGRSYPPSTGQDWEGRGVAPDRAVAPAEALDVVLSDIASADTERQHSALPDERIHQNRRARL